MRVLVIADIDDLKWRGGVGQADVLVSCGDICDQLILQAAAAYDCRQIFAVKGNHDLPSPFPAPIVDLHLHAEEHKGVRFGGFNGSWKYKPRGLYIYEQDDAAVLLKEFPGVDVFVSHNSPRGIHDKQDKIHTGFEALGDYIRRQEPKVLIHGHQHVNAETEVGGTRVIGVYGHRAIDV